MTHAEVLAFYNDLTLGALGGNHAHFSITHANEPKLETYRNLRRGLVVLSLIAFIESNFLTAPQLKKLRKFEATPGISVSINRTHISGYIYIRDCFAHSSHSLLLSLGPNTSAFIYAVNTGAFPFARISGDNLYVNSHHDLKLIILKFFE